MDYRQQFIDLCDEITVRLDEYDPDEWGRGWWDDVWKLTHDLEDAKDHLPFTGTKPALLIWEFNPTKDPCKHIQRWCEDQWAALKAKGAAGYWGMCVSDPLTGKYSVPTVAERLPGLTRMETPSGFPFQSVWRSYPQFAFVEAEKAARKWLRAAERLPVQSGEKSTEDDQRLKDPRPIKDQHVGPFGGRSVHELTPQEQLEFCKDWEEYVHTTDEDVWFNDERFWDLNHGVLEILQTIDLPSEGMMYFNYPSPDSLSTLPDAQRDVGRAVTRLRVMSTSTDAADHNDAEESLLGSTLLLARYRYLKKFTHPVRFSTAAKEDELWNKPDTERDDTSVLRGFKALQTHLSQGNYGVELVIKSKSVKLDRHNEEHESGTK